MKTFLIAAAMVLMMASTSMAGSPVDYSWSDYPHWAGEVFTAE